MSKKLTFEQFEDSRVMVHTHRPDALTYSMLGLAGEAGEVVEAYKKALRRVEPDMVHFDRDAAYASQIEDELGDVLWYMAAIAKEIGTTLEDVARANIEKLELRAREGKRES